MTIRSFLKYVEIQTKTASQFPLIFGTLYAACRYRSFRPAAFIFMFISLLLFDMATTAINNYMDYRKAKDEEYRRSHNIIGIARIPKRQAAAAIFILLGAAAAAGTMLVSLTGITVLLLGALSFFIGIFYTFGPIPISRMPLGEVFSGVLMGFVIVYLSVYIHVPEIAAVSASSRELLIRIDMYETLCILLASLPFVFSISNLMLANNICDLPQDIENDRFLLPYYIGVQNSLRLYSGCYYAAYISIIAAVIISALPLWSLLSLLSFPPVFMNIRLFRKKQIKSETFSTAVKNLVIISLSCILPLIPAVILK